MKEERPRHPVHCDYIQAVAESVSIPVIAKSVTIHYIHVTHPIETVYEFNRQPFWICLSIWHLQYSWYYCLFLVEALQTSWRHSRTSRGFERRQELRPSCWRGPPCGTPPSSGSRGRCLWRRWWRSTSDMWVTHVSQAPAYVVSNQNKSLTLYKKGPVFNNAWQILLKHLLILVNIDFNIY